MKPPKRYSSIISQTGLILLTFLALMLYPAEHINNDAYAQNNLKPPAGAEGESIEINSERMRSLEGGKKIIFSGNVVATWGNLEIKADVLEIHNAPKKQSKIKSDTGNITGDQNLDEIIAIGNVHITRGNKKAKGDRAVYYDKLQKIVLTGSPNATAWEDKNIINGKEMVFYLNDDRIVVNDKVTVVLFPNKKKVKTGNKSK